MSRIVSGLSIALVIFLSAGCSKNTSSSWQEALSSLSSTDTAIYSFRFADAPPNGMFYRFSIHDVSATAACERYTSDAVGDFWYIEADINDTLLGDHPISLVQREDEPIHTANVSLLHRQNGALVAVYNGVSGTVTLSSTPTTADANAGSPLQGHVEIDFPEHALTEVDCQGAQAADSSIVYSSCTCEDDQGKTSTCTPASPGERCCYDLESSRVHASFDLNATPCGAMCAFASGLPAEYCESIGGFLTDAAAANYSTPTCGTSDCEQNLWPRLIIGFGDGYAAGLTYTVVDNNGVTSTAQPTCPYGFVPSEIHCNLGVDGDRTENQFTLMASSEAGVLATETIPLTPFNYCGIGAAYVLVSSDESGTTPILNLEYISPCQSL